MSSMYTNNGNSLQLNHNRKIDSVQSDIESNRPIATIRQKRLANKPIITSHSDIIGRHHQTSTSLSAKKYHHRNTTSFGNATSDYEQDPLLACCVPLCFSMCRLNFFYR